MNVWQKKKRTIKAETNNNNRINITTAIIFLLAGGIIFKLFSLQALDHDLYLALASGQHNIVNQLKPERGRIFIEDYGPAGSNEKFYPLATNKKYAQLYAIPKAVTEPAKLAEQLYLNLNQAQVEKEVEKLIDSLAGREELTREFIEIKKEAEVKLREEAIIEAYIKTLSKRGDPYEPIAKRVDELTLKNLYFNLGRQNNQSFDLAALEIKNGVMTVNSGDRSSRKLALAGLDFVMENQRYYPENNFSSHLLGFVGYQDEKQRGQYGLEGFFEAELAGNFGSVKADRSAVGELIIINDRELEPPQNGADLILTIIHPVQFTVCAKLKQAVKKYDADSGTVIIMRPGSGEIIAMCSSPDFDPNNYQAVEDIKIYNNPAIFIQYEPGSIFKPITMAAALDAGKITPGSTYNDEGSVMVEGWPKPIKNSDFDSHGGYGLVDMTTVLESSLNTGAVFAMRQIGPRLFAQYVKNFGFGEKTGIELETEAAGDLRNLLNNQNSEIYAATASFGQGLTVTPIQMISAYAAIANGGMLVKPYLVKTIINSDGSKTETKPRQIRRVISDSAATLVSGMLVNVVESGHAKLAGVKGYYVAGKTGTAQVASSVNKGYSDSTIHSFVGFAPVEESRFVMLVKLDNPKSVAFAASSAAPLFGELAEYMLNLWQVPKER